MPTLRTALAEYLSYKGRMGRRKFGLVILVGIALGTASAYFLFVLDSLLFVALAMSLQRGGAILMGIAFLVPGLPLLGYAAVLGMSAIRRLRDLNQSPWLAFFLLIPYLNVAFCTYLILAKGDRAILQQIQNRQSN